MARGGGRGVLGQEAVHHRPEERGSVLGRVVRAQLKGGLSVQYLSVIGAILVRYVYIVTISSFSLVPKKKTLLVLIE